MKRRGNGYLFTKKRKKRGALTLPWEGGDGNQISIEHIAE